MPDDPPPNAWIAVIERGEQWTAALKSALCQQGAPGYAGRVRRLDHRPPPERLDPSAAVLLCVELVAHDLFTPLTYIHRARGRSNVAAVALIDRRAYAGDDDAQRRRELTLAALEAGACLAVASPRAADRVARVALRSLARMSEASLRGLSPAERAWRRLPWQAEPWPVG